MVIWLIKLIVADSLPQVKPGRDGYVYCFTSMAEGPMLSSMAMQQILVLLHVIHSFIPEECILETDLLKPTFTDSAKGGDSGLEKLLELIPLSEDEWKQEKQKRLQTSRMRVCDIPPDVIIDASKQAEDDDDDDDDNLPNPSAAAAEEDNEEGGAARAMQRHNKIHYKTRPIDVAEILVAPVSVTYSVPQQQQQQPSAAVSLDHPPATVVEKEKMAVFWVVMLRTRKCYNFAQHLQCMINDLDREDRSRIQKLANREYEEASTQFFPQAT